MIGSRVAKRYAGALFQQALSEGVIDRVGSDLRLINSTMAGMASLRQFYLQPMVPASRKKSATEILFEGKIQDLTLRFIFLLIDKRRESTIEQVLAEYEALANEARGVVVARVTTAISMTPDQEARLQAQLQVATGKTVRMETGVDPAIIGGVRVRIGDTVMDGSIQGALNDLAQRLRGHLR